MRTMSNEEFMKGVRARLEEAAREAAEAEERAEQEAEARARGKGELVQFPPKGSEEELIRRQRIEEEKRWSEAANHNRARIRELQQMGAFHAGRKQADLEAEYWAKQQQQGI